MCNKSRGRKQDNATMQQLKQREEKRRTAQEADMFSKLVMEMVL